MKAATICRADRLMRPELQTFLRRPGFLKLRSRAPFRNRCAVQSEPDAPPSENNEQRPGLASRPVANRENAPGDLSPRIAKREKKLAQKWDGGLAVSCTTAGRAQRGSQPATKCTDHYETEKTQTTHKLAFPKCQTSYNTNK